MDELFSDLEEDEVRILPDETHIWYRWKDCMKNVKTKTQLMFQLEKLKRDMWVYLEDNNGRVELKRFGIPKLLLNDTISHNIGPFIVAKQIKVDPIKILGDWFESMGIKYKIIDMKKFVYFSVEV